MDIRFVKFSNFYFVFSGLLIILSILAIFIFGLNWGIDFIGGTVINLSYEQRPETGELGDILKELGLDNFSIRKRGDNEFVIRTAEVNQQAKNNILEHFKDQDIKMESVSPVIGSETKVKARNAIIYAVIAIVIYIAVVFRKVSRPVRSWQYGIATVIALVHDVLIPVGIFSVLGHFLGVEFSIPVLTALLTIFGYSVNDTVVVFDRIRENLITGKGNSFNDVVDESLNQTLVRSVNTSLTTLFVLLFLFFFGGQTLTWFSLALIIGTIMGTYSSIFLASTLLARWLLFSHRLT